VPALGYVVMREGRKAVLLGYTVNVLELLVYSVEWASTENPGGRPEGRLEGTR
jgi:hypothetical protein